MLVVVYGTLKRGYGNNRILQAGKAEFIKEVKIPGYKLYNCGFPVAKAEEGAVSLGELWDIGDNPDTLRALDRLESEGSMYNRVPIRTESGEEAQMYVGHPRAWDFSETKINRWGLDPCPTNAEGEYFWARGA